PEIADCDFTRRSPNGLSRPSIPVRPVWTRRAFLPDRVVDAFFVWAPDDPRTYHDSLHVMGRHEVKRGAAGILVGRERSFGEPRAKSRLTDRVAPEAPS